MKRGAGRKQEWTSVSLDIKFSKKIPISEAKKKDLKYLMNCKIILNDYYQFYNDLQTTNKCQPQMYSDDENTAD